MLFAKNQAAGFNLEHIGWKYYNTIRKKAVEQEFSWSGLLISLSIAFFIVIISAFMLNFLNHSIQAGRLQPQTAGKNIYLLEKNIYLSGQTIQGRHNGTLTIKSELC